MKPYVFIERFGTFWNAGLGRTSRFQKLEEDSAQLSAQVEPPGHFEDHCGRSWLQKVWVVSSCFPLFGATDFLNHWEQFWSRWSRVSIPFASRWQSWRGSGNAPPKRRRCDSAEDLEEVCGNTWFWEPSTMKPGRFWRWEVSGSLWILVAFGSCFEASPLIFFGVMTCGNSFPSSSLL